jgi:uncharacterized membrane protein
MSSDEVKLNFEYTDKERDLPEAPLAATAGVWFHAALMLASIVGYLITIGLASQGDIQTSKHIIWVPLCLITIWSFLVSILKKRRTRELIDSITNREVKLQTCPDYFEIQFDNKNNKKCVPKYTTKSATHPTDMLTMNSIYKQYEFNTDDNTFILDTDVNSSNNPKDICKNADDTTQQPWSEKETKCKRVSSTSPNIRVNREGYINKLLKYLFESNN